MNVIKFNMEKEEFKVYICKQYEGGKEFIIKKLDEISSHEKLFSEEEIFLFFFLLLFYGFFLVKFLAVK